MTKGLLKILLAISLGLTPVAYAQDTAPARPLGTAGMGGVYRPDPRTFFGQCTERVNSETCQKLKGQPGLLDMMGCAREEQIAVDVGIFAGCASGVFNAAWDLVKFLGQAAWAVGEGATAVTRGTFNYLTDGNTRAATHENIKGALETSADYLRSIYGYVGVELQRTFNSTDMSLLSPVKAWESMKATSGKMMGSLLAAAAEIISNEYQEFKCFNQVTRTEKICQLAGTIFIPPAAFFALIKGGAKALKAHPVLNDKLKAMFSRNRIPGSLPPNAPDRLVPAERMGYSNMVTGSLKPLTGRSSDIAEQTLQKGQIQDIKKLSMGGINESYWLTFPDGQRAIWKPLPSNKAGQVKPTWGANYRAEVLAYELDRKWGIDLVPPTVARSVDGRPGSVQLFKASGSQADAKPEQLNKLSFFDYLIDNRDRHRGNWLASPSGDVIAIDNGLSFTGAGYNGREFAFRKTEIQSFLRTPEGASALNRVEASLNDPKFRKEVVQYLGKTDADEMFKRMKYMIRFNQDLNRAGP